MTRNAGTGCAKPFSVSGSSVSKAPSALVLACVSASTRIWRRIPSTWRALAGDNTSPITIQSQRKRCAGTSSTRLKRWVLIRTWVSAPVSAHLVAEWPRLGLPPRMTLGSPSLLPAQAYMSSGALCAAPASAVLGRLITQPIPSSHSGKPSNARATPRIESSWKPKEVPLRDDCILGLDADCTRRRLSRSHQRHEKPVAEKMLGSADSKAMTLCVQNAS